SNQRAIPTAVGPPFETPKNPASQSKAIEFSLVEATPPTHSQRAEGTKANRQSCERNWFRNKRCPIERAFNTRCAFPRKSVGSVYVIHSRRLAISRSRQKNLAPRESRLLRCIVGADGNRGFLRLHRSWCISARCAPFIVSPLS